MRPQDLLIQLFWKYPIFCKDSHDLPDFANRHAAYIQSYQRLWHCVYGR